MARDEQRMFRIHDAPKPAITPADFQRLMLKKAKAQALARALHTARQRQAAAEQPAQPSVQPGAGQSPSDCRPDSDHPQPGAPGHADLPQSMVIDDAATPDAHQADGGAAEGRQQGQPSEQSAADAAEARQQEAAHSAALRRQLIQSRKEALSRQRREAHEAEEARRHSEYQRRLEEHEAAEAARRQQAAAAAAEAQRLAADAAAKAAQAEELRRRFEALSAQKGELVQQLKQVLERERSSGGAGPMRTEPQLSAAEAPAAAQLRAGRDAAAPAPEPDIALPPHLAGNVTADEPAPMVVNAPPDDIDLPPHLLSQKQRGAKGRLMPPPPPLAHLARRPK